MCDVEDRVHISADGPQSNDDGQNEPNQTVMIGPRDRELNEPKIVSKLSVGSGRGMAETMRQTLAAHLSSTPPSINPVEQNPPCNTLYIGNLPMDASEDELKAIFSKQHSYKRLCFRTKQNGPMCFVEFDDTSSATKALGELYGHMLHNSVNGGIRLSFSKNPLGVRSSTVGNATPPPGLLHAPEYQHEALPPPGQVRNTSGESKKVARPISSHALQDNISLATSDSGYASSSHPSCPGDERSAKSASASVDVPDANKSRRKSLSAAYVFTGDHRRSRRTSISRHLTPPSYDPQSSAESSFAAPPTQRVTVHQDYPYTYGRDMSDSPYATEWYSAYTIPTRGSAAARGSPQLETDPYTLRQLQTEIASLKTALRGSEAEAREMRAESKHVAQTQQTRIAELEQCVSTLVSEEARKEELARMSQEEQLHQEARLKNQLEGQISFLQNELAKKEAAAWKLQKDQLDQLAVLKERISQFEGEQVQYEKTALMLQEERIDGNWLLKRISLLETEQMQHECAVQGLLEKELDHTAALEQQILRLEGERNVWKEKAEATWSRSVHQFCVKIIGSLLVHLQYLEPPLQPGLTRLRWQCRCGDEFFGDVHEYRKGGIKRLVDRMQRSSGSTVVATSYNEANSNQKYTSRSPYSFQGIVQGYLTVLSIFSKPSPGLPQHRSPGDTLAGTSSRTGSLDKQQTLHLMVCMQRGRYRRTVHQGRIDEIETDKALFVFLRRQIARHRGRIRKMFSLKCIQAMYFVKFRLRACGSAEVRNHEPCCTSSVPRICECIPPAPKVEPAPDAEYRCAPAGPLETWPPVLSEELMHMLTSPQCIDPKETFVLQQLPKRTKGELKGSVGQPAEGWGIHFQEGWDFDLLIGIVLSIFLVASFLFAILWSHFKLDVQGAFGVSSYMVTASGIFVAWFANRAGKTG